MSSHDQIDLHVRTVVLEMRRRAARGLFDGTERGLPYINLCSVDSHQTGTRLIYTRDTGHHSSGWLKNPDYERCLHLSLSPLQRIILLRPQLAELDRKMVDLWTRAFFGEDLRKVWVESPKSEGGKQRGVTHWRLFCDEHWRPILPRKEVYTKEFTELGWKSASEVSAEGGIHVSETEDGRQIISTVDPT